MELYFFSYSGLINAITSFALGSFVLFKNSRSPTNRSFAYFAFSVGWWAIFYFLWLSTKQAHLALFFIRSAMEGAILIPVTYVYFTTRLLAQEKKFLNIANFVLAGVFICFSFSPVYIHRVEPRLFFPFWPAPGYLFHFMLLYFLLNVVYAHVNLWRAGKKFQGVRKIRIKYVFFGTLIGFLGGCTNYFLWYKIPIPPYLNFLVSVYVVCVAWAIIRYRLMDVRIAISRAAIFGVVYTLVLGIPFGIGYKLFGSWGPWFILVAIAVLSASAGPFIYFYFQRKAEGRILREDRRAQEMLTKASEDMTTIRELKKLLNLIVYLVSRQMKVKNSSIYLLDKDTNSYLVKAARLPSRVQNLEPIDRKDPLVEHIHKVRLPLVYEEVKMQAQTEHSQNLSECEVQMRKMNAALIVPAFIGDFLTGFLILDEKRDGRTYSQEALNVLQVLANQAALAIENAIFFEERGKTLAETFHEDNLRSIGTLGAGVGHQINNRFNAIAVPSQTISYKIKKRNLDKLSSQELKELIRDSEKALDVITEDALRGGKIATSLTSFSRKTEGYGLVPFVKVIDEVLNLLSCKFNLKELNLKQEISKDTPPLWGNLSQLEDVFFNLLDNAHDALKTKQKELQAGKLEGKLEDYKGKVELKTWIADKKPSEKKKMLTITVEDNGIGMTPEQLEKLFIPFYTTKATAGKGTGLGLWIIKQIIEAHGGSIGVESEYGKYTKFIINLPLATKQQIESSPPIENTQDIPNP